MDCWLKASSVAWYTNVLIGIRFRRARRRERASERPPPAAAPRSVAITPMSGSDVDTSNDLGHPVNAGAAVLVLCATRTSVCLMLGLLAAMAPAKADPIKTSGGLVSG